MDLRTLRLPIVIFLIASAGCGGSREARGEAGGEFGTVPGADGKATTGVATAAPAAGATAAPTAGAAGTALADQPKAINTRCPVTGETLGADAVTVTVTTEVILPPRTYVIACADAAAAKKVSAEPNKYIPAVLHNVAARHDADPIDNPR